MKFQSVITWSLSIAGLMILFFSIFSSIAEDMEALNSVMANYPPELLAAFGWDQMDLGTVLGFFAFAFSFIQIMISLQAANYGYSLVSVEERELTADFLLAKPVSRVKILTGKLLTALTCLLITNVVLWGVSFAAVGAYAGDRSYDTDILAKVLTTVIFLQLFFLMVGLAVSLLVKKVPSVISLSMGTVFGMYILAAFGGSLGEDKFDYLTPFKHFEATKIVHTGEFDLPKVMISVTVILISVVASYVLYQRRDIPTV
ncbi:MAG: ABC transporter permease subunit [Gammaproteobacteria bacterium]|nr:ABC transporter permease subunit [Gammaproteobacteria bacterium]